MSLVSVLADLLTAAALLSGGAVLIVTRSWRAALPVLLELLTAVGLVRLSGIASWSAIGSAALILVIRRLVVRSVAQRPGPVEDSPSR
jgi:hypothetical protein